MLPKIGSETRKNGLRMLRRGRKRRRPKRRRSRTKSNKINSRLTETRKRITKTKNRNRSMSGRRTKGRTSTMMHMRVLKTIKTLINKPTAIKTSIRPSIRSFVKSIHPKRLPYCDLCSMRRTTSSP